MRHLTSVQALTDADLDYLLDPTPPSPPSGTGPAALLFYEKSTRTKATFWVSAQNMGVPCFDLDPSRSAEGKGETVQDTVQNLAWMGFGSVVIRTPTSGLPRSLTHLGVSIINAGDGLNEHPTQALADASVLLQRFGSLKGLRVAILGDVSWSRVARSNYRLLTRLGAEVLLSGIHDCQERELHQVLPLSVVLPQADAVIFLRWQEERHHVSSHTFLQDLDEHFHLISPGVPVMHPGPVVWQGRPYEALLRGPQSLLGEQVRQGVRVRERLWSWVTL